MKDAVKASDKRVLNGSKPGEQAPLMTLVGLVEGDVLSYLDQRGATTLGKVGHDLDWQPYLVVMAIGALIRMGLVQGVQQGFEIAVRLKGPLA